MYHFADIDPDDTAAVANYAAWRQAQRDQDKAWADADAALLELAEMATNDPRRQHAKARVADARRRAGAAAVRQVERLNDHLEHARKRGYGVRLGEQVVQAAQRARPQVDEPGPDDDIRVVR